MCFGCSKELSCRDGSFEHPQHMFWLRKKIQWHTLICGPGYILYVCSFQTEINTSLVLCLTSLMLGLQDTSSFQTGQRWPRTLQYEMLRYQCHGQRRLFPRRPNRNQRSPSTRRMNPVLKVSIDVALVTSKQGITVFIIWPRAWECNNAMQ